MRIVTAARSAALCMAGLGVTNSGSRSATERLELQQSAVVKNHRHGGGCHYLGDRGEIEDGVGLDGRAMLGRR